MLGEVDKKMFPFDSSKSMLFIGNKKNIEMIIIKLLELNFELIKIIGKDLSKEKNALKKFNNVEYVTYSSNLSEVLAEAINEKDTLLYDINAYVSSLDLENFVFNYYSGENKVLLQKNDKNNFDFKDYICAMANDYVESFYANPRESYVNSRITGVSIVSKEMSYYIKNSPNQFLNVNVGVSVKDGFYLEQSLNEAIKDGHRIVPVFTKDSSVYFKFPWDILEANYLETKKITDEIIIGNNSVVDETVIFEGKAIVGDNCIIKNGAIIENEVIIGDNTVIKNHAKISKNTVIGNKNKIGHAAEITGVTYENVAIVHNSHICGLIGSNVDIGAGTNTANLRFDDTNENIIINGRRYSNKYTNYAFVGDSTRTGIGVLISPGVRIGRNSAVGSGAIVNNDIQNEEILLVKQEQVKKSWKRR